MTYFTKILRILQKKRTFEMKNITVLRYYMQICAFCAEAAAIRMCAVIPFRGASVFSF